MNITRYNSLQEPRCPCQEHQWYSTRYRFDIAPHATIESCVRICDLCGQISITDRCVKKLIKDVSDMTRILIKKEGRHIGKLCRLKRRVKNAVGHFFERHFLNEPEIMSGHSRVFIPAA